MSNNDSLRSNVKKYFSATDYYLKKEVLIRFSDIQYVSLVKNENKDGITCYSIKIKDKLDSVVELVLSDKDETDRFITEYKEYIDSIDVIPEQVKLYADQVVSVLSEQIKVECEKKFNDTLDLFSLKITNIMDSFVTDLTNSSTNILSSLLEQQQSINSKNSEQLLVNQNLINSSLNLNVQISDFTNKINVIYSAIENISPLNVDEIKIIEKDLDNIYKELV